MHSHFIAYCNAVLLSLQQILKTYLYYKAREDNKYKNIAINIQSTIYILLLVL